MKRFAAIVCFFAVPLFCQSNNGELRLKVTDPDGLGVRTTVQVVSQANQYRRILTTGDQGRLDIERLPFGIYQLEISQPGFAQISKSIDIHSSIPIEFTLQLSLPTVQQSVTVSEERTLINPDQAGAVSQVGTDDIKDRVGSVPGRALQDLVNSQPGWLYEGNAVLHPR
ncbi:MAG: carboxypeptidase-like regulatory domain-containing protein, partial [Terriglobales bacterium]